MAAKPQMNEEEVLRRLREHVEGNGGISPEVISPNAEPSSPRSEFVYDFSGAKRILKRAEYFQASVGQINPRPRGPHNALIQAAKKIIRRTVTWYMRPIQGVSEATVDLGRDHTRALEALVEHQRSLAIQLKALQRETFAYRETAQASFRELQTRQSQTQTLFEQVRPDIVELLNSHVEQRMRRLEMWLRRLQKHPAATDPKSSTSQPIESPQDGNVDFDYYLFEQYYRGSESLIKERQQDYIGIFRGRSKVLDLGCGRGEFLELMRDLGVGAEGVEFSEEAVMICKEKALQVTRSDLLGFLERCEDHSIDGIFSAQVIEHLPVELQLRYIDLAYRKLIPGSPIVLETINPQCVFALVRNFYLDPTHVRPVHPEFLKFALESKGFEKVKVRFSGPYDEAFTKNLETARYSSEELRQAILRLNEFCFGYQDYAAIGWRG